MTHIPRSDVTTGQWDTIVSACPSGTFFQSSHWLDYCCKYRSSVKDASVVLVEHGRIVGVMPVIIESDQIAMGGEPNAWPVRMDGNDDGLLHDVMGYAQTVGVTKVSLRDRPTLVHGAFSADVPPSWHLWSWRTRVVELVDDEVLWRGIRRSYHSLINRVRKDPDLHVRRVNGHTFLRACRDLHRAAAGRITRPLETWQLQAQWLDHGLAHAYMLTRGESNALAFVYIAVWKNWAYYFSGASIEPNMMHALQYETMLALRKDRVRFYELGWQDRHDSEKERGVAKFKAGFGGTDWHVRAVTLKEQ